MDGILVNKSFLKQVWCESLPSWKLKAKRQLPARNIVQCKDGWGILYQITQHSGLMTPCFQLKLTHSHKSTSDIDWFQTIRSSEYRHNIDY